VDGWLNEPNQDFDYGVMFLDSPTLGGSVGNFEVLALSNSELDGVTACICGYPADRDQAEYQYYHERPLQGSSPTRLFYDIDTYGGQSGSPIWQQTTAGESIAIGIHTTGSLSGNSGTRISDSVLENLITWIGQA
jgi:glutamyl endopeptidase